MDKLEVNNETGNKSPKNNSAKTKKDTVQNTKPHEPKYPRKRTLKKETVELENEFDDFKTLQNLNIVSVTAEKPPQKKFTPRNTKKVHPIDLDLDNIEKAIAAALQPLNVKPTQKRKITPKKNKTDQIDTDLEDKEKKLGAAMQSSQSKQTQEGKIAPKKSAEDTKTDSDIQNVMLKEKSTRVTRSKNLNIQVSETEIVVPKKSPLKRKSQEKGVNKNSNSSIKDTGKKNRTANK